MSRTFSTLLAVLGLTVVAPARAALPVVEDLDPKPLAENCKQVAAALEKLGAPLPSETRKALDQLLAHAKPDDLPSGLQELLDPHCLIGVSINPESRVKAARGPAKAELRRDAEAFYLIKVQNEAGVTGALKVTSPQGIPARATRDGWLEISLYADPPAAKLNGRKVQYTILRLKARAAGKREATLKFDVGQGTQDLGFRAEVPVLFTVRPQ